MASADTILVLGSRGLLGRAVVSACPEECRIIEGRRESFDLSTCTWWVEGGESGAGSVVSSQEAGEIVSGLGRELAQMGPGAADIQAGCAQVQEAIVETAPDIVINCAGYTDVDRAEQEPDLAMAVNGAGAGAVARACAQVGAHLVHISTDYVFDGKLSRPYREDDPTSPLGVYAKSKLEGERRVFSALPSALIVRSAWLFGPDRPGFVEKILEKAGAGETFKVVSDQVGSPTYTVDLGTALVRLAQRRASGLVHLVNLGKASRYELARQSLRLSGLDPELVRPAATAELEGPWAARPAFSALDTRRVARLLGGPLPTWLDGLKRHLSESGQS